MANEFIIRKGYKSLAASEVTGSLKTTGDITVSGTGLSTVAGQLYVGQTSDYFGSNTNIQLNSGASNKNVGIRSNILYLYSHGNGSTSQLIFGDGSANFGLFSNDTEFALYNYGTSSNSITVNRSTNAATFAGIVNVDADFKVRGASGEDHFVVAPQAAGSGTILISYNGAESGYEPLVVDAENFAFRHSGTPIISTSGTATTFAGNLTIPEYIVHTGDGDTKIGFNTNNSVEIRAGGNLQINADASRSYLRYQGSSKLYTDTSGVIVSGKVNLNQAADEQGLEIKGYDDHSSSDIKLQVNSAGHARLSQTTDGGSGYLFLQAENYLQLIAGTFTYTTSTFRVYDNTEMQFGNSGDYKISHKTSGDKLIIQTDDNKGITIDNAGNATFSEDVTIQGILTAQQFNTELVSASIIFESGSTIFGNSSDDTHVFTGSITAKNTVDGDYTGLRIMNQKTYGSGTGTNETARLVLGIAENGVANSSREGFVIETYTAEETDSSNINTEFKVRDGGTVGTAIKITGASKNVDFYNHVNLQDGKYLMWGGNAILQHNGTQTYIGDNSSSSVITVTGGNSTFSGNTQAPKFIAAQGTSYANGYQVTRSGHDTYRIGLGNSEGLRIINETDGNREELAFDGAGNAAFSGVLKIPSYIEHVGDTDSFFGFNSTDTWKLRLGGGDRMIVDTNRISSNVHISLASGKYLEFLGTGALLNVDIAGWTAGQQEHNILYAGWTSSTGDYLSLRAAGNSAADHGNLIIGDSGLWYGIMDGTTSAAATDSATNPHGDSNRFRVDTSGNGTFAGNVNIPSGYVGRDAHNGAYFSTDDSIIFRVADSHRFRMNSDNFSPYVDASYNLGTTSKRWNFGYFNNTVQVQDGHIKAGGNNLKLHAGGVHVINMDLNKNFYPQTHNDTDIGFSDSLAFRHAYFSGTGKFSNVNASSYQLNGTYIVDSSRNLVNIGSITTGNSILISYSGNDGAGIDAGLKIMNDGNDWGAYIRKASNANFGLRIDSGGGNAISVYSTTGGSTKTFNVNGGNGNTDIAGDLQVGTSLANFEAGFGVAIGDKNYNYGAEFQATNASIQIVLGRNNGTSVQGRGAIGADQTNAFAVWNTTSTTKQFEVTHAGNTTIAGDLTVTGGDISLSGTGRIQGIDTVSAATDAANKAYVDANAGGISNVVEDTTPQLGGNLDMNGKMLFETDQRNSIDLNDHSSYAWLRNAQGGWVFQQGTAGDNWTLSYNIFLPAGNTAGNNDEFMQLGQRASNSTNGSYKGTRIVQYKGGIVDGQLKASLGYFSGDTVEGVSDSHQAGIFLPTATRGVSGLFASSYARNLIRSNGSETIEIGDNTSLLSLIKLNAGSSGVNGVVSFMTKAQERMRVHHNGYVGIGTTSPGAKFEVGGANSAIWINPADGAHSGLHFRQGGTFRGFVGFNDTTETVNIGMDGSIVQGININSSHYVGIGTAVPTEQLHVSASAADILLQSGTSGQASRYILKTADQEWRMGTHSGLNNNLWFYNQDTAAYRMTLTPTGNLGLNFNTPGYLIHASNGANSRADIQLTYNALGTSTSDGVQMGIQGGGAYLWNFENSDVYFGVNNSKKMSIKPDGDVGIGTASPAGKLDVEAGDLGGTSGDEKIAAIIRAGRQNLVFKDTRTANGTDWNNATFKIIAQIDSTNHQSIDFVNDSGYLEHIDIRTGNQVFHSRFTSTGRLGIGTTSPGGALHVYNGGSERFLIDGDVKVAGSTDLMITGASRRLSFTNGSGTIRTTTGNSLILQTNSADGIVIDGSTQNVSMGSTSKTASNNYVLDVKKAYSSGNGHVAYFGAGSNTIAKLNYDTVIVGQDDVPCLAIVEGNNGNSHSTEQALRLAVGDNNAVISTSNTSGGLHFFVNRGTNSSGYLINTGTKALYLLNNGNVNVPSGNLGIGTDSPSYKLQVQGTGYFNSTLYVNGTTTINDDLIIDHNIIGNSKNFATSNAWASGSGTQTGYYGGNFGGDSQGIVKYDVGPFGARELIQETVPDTGNDYDGGWNKTITELDINKAHMSVVYVRRTTSQSNGSFYHGTGTTAGQILNLNGTNNTNPYFQSTGVSNLPENVWCVSIGFIQASHDTNTDTGTQYNSRSGIYRLDTGQKINNGSVYKFGSGGSTLTNGHRVFMYYSTDNATKLQFARPGFYEMNGDAPTFESLVGRPVAITINQSGNPTLAANVTAAEVRSLIGAGTSDASTLDGIDSSQFLRSDANDTTTGNLTISKGSNPVLHISSTDGGSAILRIGRTADTQAEVTAGDQSASDLCFRTGGSRRVQITSGGQFNLYGNFIQNGGRTFLSGYDSSSNLNTIWQAAGTSREGGILPFRFQAAASNAPSTNDNANWGLNIYSHAGSGGGYPYGIQLAGANASSGENSLQLRTVSNGSFGSWKKVFHEGHLPTMAEAGVTTATVEALGFLRSDAADTSTGEILFDAGFKSDSILLTGAQNFDNISRSGFYNLYNTQTSSTNSPPFTYGTMIVVGGNKQNNSFGLQIAHERTGTGLYVRGMNDSSSTWYDWDEIWTSGTDGDGSGLDADLLDGMQPKSATGAAGSNQILRSHSNGYLYMKNWIDVGSSGLFSTTTNGAHLYPNGGSDYGTWRSNGSRGGYNGIVFDMSGTVYNALLSNATEIGLFNDADNEWYVKATRNQGVQLYYNNGEKLKTTSVGVDVTGTVTHDGLAMTSGTSVDQLYSVNMTYQLASNTWTDTGVNSSELATGTYAIQLFVDDHSAGGGHYDVVYSGMMSWYGSSTNSTNFDEIVLHRVGHATNNSIIQLRTLMHANGGDNVMLQIKQNFSHSAAMSGTTDGKRHNFKFRRLI